VGGISQCDEEKEETGRKGAGTRESAGGGFRAETSKNETFLHRGKGKQGKKQEKKENKENNGKGGPGSSYAPLRFSLVKGWEMKWFSYI